MPLYLYRHPETNETIEVVQGMNDEHTFFDEEGIEWKRVWTKPNASIDSSVNPFSENDFLKKTSHYNRVTQGDLMDMSAELSQKRESKEGVDPVKQKFFKDYEKKVGKKHLADTGPKVIKKGGITVEL